jgi:hypothetical protein
LSHVVANRASASAVPRPTFNNPISKARTGLRGRRDKRNVARTRAWWNRDDAIADRNECTWRSFLHRPLKACAARTHVYFVSRWPSLQGEFGDRSADPGAKGRFHRVLLRGAGANGTFNRAQGNKLQSDSYYHGIRPDCRPPTSPSWRVVKPLHLIFCPIMRRPTQWPDFARLARLAAFEANRCHSSPSAFAAERSKQDHAR